ncbi:hypothetical protein GCM10022422_16680 [Flavobacterium ginsengisoli]|uniref:Uncharacterized protein n=1 Tax=Flavobacterium ginsengisoli TaxID=871694 RepID=A0ABP7F9V9_9FLAO
MLFVLVSSFCEMLHSCFRFNRKDAKSNARFAKIFYFSLPITIGMADNANFCCDENIYADFKIKSAESARENLKTKI